MKSLKVIIALGAIVAMALFVYAWVAARRDAQAMKETIAAQNKILNAANADKRKDDSNLQTALAQINSSKRKVRTPSAALQGLNQSLPLPQPLTFVPVEDAKAATEGDSSAGGSPGPSQASFASMSQSPSGLPTAQRPKPAGSATIPAIDLIPLYRHTQDCRACSVELDAARVDTLDDQKKIAALIAERKAAVKASRGGSVVRRIKQSAIWLVVGAGAGYALSTRFSHARLPKQLTPENQYYVTVNSNWEVRAELRAWSRIRGFRLALSGGWRERGWRWRRRGKQRYE
jgi:hypothetical protein